MISNATWSHNLSVGGSFAIGCLPPWLKSQVGFSDPLSVWLAYFLGSFSQRIFRARPGGHFGRFRGFDSPSPFGRFWRPVRASLLAGFGVRLSLFLRIPFLFGSVTKAVALAGDLDDLGMLQEAIQDRGRGGHIADELAPIL